MTDTTNPATLPRYGWLDRSEVYHDIKRHYGLSTNVYIYGSVCGQVFIEASTGNEPPSGRRLCKWCERARARDAAIAEYCEESDD